VGGDWTEACRSSVPGSINRREKNSVPGLQSTPSYLVKPLKTLSPNPAARQVKN
jgi:hypothetical protein